MKSQDATKQMNPFNLKTTILIDKHVIGSTPCSSAMIK